MVTNTIPTVAVIGGGQIGSRYLQGLVACNHQLKIHLLDPNLDALGVARERWIDAGGPGSPHSVEFHDRPRTLPQHLQLAIVSTTAGARPGVMESLSEYVTTDSWVLEKVLAQSHCGLDRITAAAGQATPVWVNTWFRTTPWFQKIRQKVGAGPVRVEINGSSWGLGCNAIHFVDLFAWWTGENLLTVDGAGLDRCWPKAKRAGHYELSGQLKVNFSSGTTVILRSTPPSDSGTPAGTGTIDCMSIETTDDLWTVQQPFSETDGLAVGKSGAHIDGRVEHQSERTGPLVDSILMTGRCELPDLVTSTRQHRVLLTGLLEDRPHLEGIAHDQVPIT
ncbi:MAG: hypothetical protein P8M16_00535 [Acidimicrobiales bacterium]|nr:hypothetical protein [Acidimicrobiales bacterium]